MSQFKIGDRIVVPLSSHPDYKYGVIDYVYVNDTYSILYSSEDSEDIHGYEIVHEYIYNSPLYQELA